MPQRTPQLNLRLDAASPLDDTPWRGGGTIAYLGTRLTLVLDTAAREPLRSGSELHLPLPPAATSRQIRDAAESWLRDEAARLFAEHCSLRIVLGFGKHGDWARRDGDILRCHWRLIEQPPGVIAQVIARAAGECHAMPASDDLFALV